MYFEGVSPEDYVIEYRAGYSPGSKDNRCHTVYIPIEVSDETISAIRISASSFGTYLNKPMVAMDYYVDSSGAIGMFEYSYGFGVDYPRNTLKKISKQFTQAIINRLNQ